MVAFSLPERFEVRKDKSSSIGGGGGFRQASGVSYSIGIRNTASL